MALRRHLPRSAPARLCAAALLLASCATPPPPPPPPVAVVVPPPPAPPPRQAPLATHRFEILPTDDVVGQVQLVITGKQDTLPDIARRFNVGYEEIVRANPGVDPWVPGEGREIVVPTRFVLPVAPREGVVINIAAMRLFYFVPPPKPVQGKGKAKAQAKASGAAAAPAVAAIDEPPKPQVVITHPIGIGKVGWSTPEGRTRIIGRQKDPVWVPPLSVRKEHLANGERLPAVVPPGPDNPLGRFKFTLGWPSYLIHGTNKPYGVGLRSSHGCIRLYPEDIQSLFELIPVGTPVQVVNQPYVMGWQDGTLQLQAVAVLEDDRRDWRKGRHALLQKTLTARIQQQLKAAGHSIDWEAAAQRADAAHGLPVPVWTGADGEVPAAPLARALRVQNRIPAGANWDGSDDPSVVP